MEAELTSDASEGEADGLTIVALPKNLAQTVLDIIANLEREEDDTSGYMLSFGGRIGSGSLNAVGKHATGTGCLSSPTGWKCSDVDRTPGDE